MTGIATLLNAWERAEHVVEVARGAEFAHRLGRLPDGWSASLGTCATALVEVHRELFGARIGVVAECRACGEALAAELELDDLPVPADASVVETSLGPIEVRPLRTVDLVAAGRSAEPAAVLWSASVGEWLELSPADRAVVDRLAEEQAGAAGVVLLLVCPACGATDQLGVDLARLVLGRLDRWAYQRLAEVAVLARAYGWSEADVLALSPRRRAHYLELAQDG